MVNLDAIDRRLLAELQANGRITNVELAQRVGLTAPPCLRRVRALEEAGAIRGYHAEIDGPKLGFSITVFAMVSLKSQAEDALRAFEAAMDALPEVREVHMLNGEIDFILKIISRVFRSELSGVPDQPRTDAPRPNVASVKTSLTIRLHEQARAGGSCQPPDPRAQRGEVKTSLTIRTSKHEPGVPLGCCCWVGRDWRLSFLDLS